jgi:single-strand DNA-binding protein
MNDHNQISIAGRLTKDPVLEKAGEYSICKFSIANNFYGGKKNPKGVSFVDVVIWGKAAETVAAYMKKGSAILLGGEIRQDRWEYQGKKMSKTYILARSFQFMGKKEEYTTPEHGPTPDSGPDLPLPKDGNEGGSGLVDDEVPF